MTVIAWDGMTLAADKQITCNGTTWTGTKIRRLHKGGSKYLAGISGEVSEGYALMAWFEAGADPASWPSFQRNEGFTKLCLITPDAHVWSINHIPTPVAFEGAFYAMGVGQDIAVGAMAAGADAIEAVRITNRFSDGCGNGIDWLTLDGKSGTCD